MYIPILKTRQSELKAVEHLDNVIKDNICPLFELTRSRKSKSSPDGDIEKRMEDITEKYGSDRPFILDITTIEYLSNNQIEELQDSANDYGNWISFVAKQKKHFPKLIPTVISNDSDALSDEDNQQRFLNQIKALSDDFDLFAYRYPADYGSSLCAADFELFQDNGINLNKIIFIIDHGFFQQVNISDNNRILESRKKCTFDIIYNDNIKQYRFHDIFVSAESFPSNPAEASDNINISSRDYHDGKIPIGAYELYKRINNNNIKYSDYATVFPEPTLQEGGRGWIPRIDLPTETDIIFGRERRKPNENYQRPYREIAENIIQTDNFKFISEKYPCWGIDNIKESAIDPTGLSPSHWIAVRVNIHMTIRCMMNFPNETP
ncbi:MAG: beta family protein [Thermoguttaceae bacterium]|nr:beta family protein [Thermoguttaceae bacterium]